MSSLTEKELHLCHTPLETDYFLKLVQYERAGSETLNSIYGRHLKQIRNQANEIINRVPESRPVPFS